jgi:chorismate mutase/prephenate dehydrogenase
MTEQKSLEQLREELGAIDRRVLELVAERDRLALEVGAAKRNAGRPVRDFQQEQEVMKRARAVAEELSLSSELADEIMLVLIRSALRVQERDRLQTARDQGGRRALVVGGCGKMGGWFVSYLSSLGFKVEVADPRPAAEGEELVQLRDWRDSNLTHDVIVLATPLSVTNEILLEMAHDPPSGLVFDIGSLKSPLRSGLMSLAESGGKVASVHPMFGPDTDMLSGRHVIFVDVGVPEATKEARALFESTTAVQVSMDLESHDRVMAYVLGLSHALNIAFFTALVDSGESAPKLATLSSTTFDDQLNVASKVSRENPTLYFEIQALNDYGTESLSALLYAVERLRSVVRAGDAKGFAALMQKGADYLALRSP